MRNNAPVRPIKPSRRLIRFLGSSILAFALLATMPALIYGAPEASPDIAAQQDTEPARMFETEDKEPIVPDSRSEEAGTEMPANADDNSADIKPNSIGTQLLEDSTDSVEQAVYPGVTNLLLEREKAGEPSIKLYYPSFNNAKVDMDIKKWLEERLAYYDSLVKDSGVEATDAASEDDSGDETANPENWEMTGFFTLEKPQADIASLLFNIYAYTGGAHGNVWLYSQIYDLKNGRSISFNDMFGKPETALRLLSAISIEKLRASIGEDTDDEWLERGAGPEMDNFSVLTLIPDGLYAEFQPYQVGPWSIGPQRVHISLSELMEASPSPLIWKLPENPTSGEKEERASDENPKQ